MCGASRYRKEVKLAEVNLMKGVKVVYLNVRSLLKQRDEYRATLLDGIFDVVIFG